MKQFGIIIIAISALVLYQFSGGPAPLTPKEFKAALIKSPKALLIDLRTEKEFTAGHLQGAMNIDCNRQSYKWRVEELDTTVPVFLYCEDGKQSREAALFFRYSGFNVTYELKGGFLQWISEGMTVTPAEIVLPKELTLVEFSRILDLEHYVIVDYYIPWDINCRKMEPVIDELAIKYGAKLKIIRINTDKYKYLATEQGIEVLPTYQFFENGNLTLTLEGITKRSVFERQLEGNEYAVLNDF